MKKPKLLSRRIRVLTDSGWQDRTGKKLNIGDSICIERTYQGGGGSSTFQCFRGKKPKSMTPVQFYKKYGVVPDGYTAKQQNGRYYCNPAHCSLSWTDKKKRDEHLDGAYAMLG
jgi:hypothetical protein